MNVQVFYADSNPWRMSVSEQRAGEDGSPMNVEIASVQIARNGEYRLSYIPETENITVTLVKDQSATTSRLTLTAYLPTKTIYEPQTVLVKVCNDTKDPYRFGFNGQQKDNEIAGIGNHNTALFWEYDTRLGRRWNMDPIYKPHESPYSVIGNNPIPYVDKNGDDSSKTTTDAGHGINGDGGAVSKDGKHKEADYTLQLEGNRQMVNCIWC